MTNNNTVWSFLFSITLVAFAETETETEFQIGNTFFHNGEDIVKEEFDTAVPLLNRRQLEIKPSYGDEIATSQYIKLKIKN